MYKSAFSELPIPALILNSDGKILDANHAVCRLTGFSLSELRKSKPGKIIFIEVADIVKENPKSDQKSGHCSVFTKTGDRFTFQYSARVYADGPSGKAIILTLISRVEAHATFPNDITLYPAILNASDDIIFTLDTSLRHTSIFGKWLKYSGLGPDFFLGKNSIEIMGEEAGKPHQQAGFEALQGHSVTYEWEADIGDGKRHFQTTLSPIFGDKGSVVGITGIGRDITPQKMVEQARKEKEEYFRSVFLNSPAIMYLVDPETLAFVDVNDAALKYYGYDKASFLGFTLKEINTQPIKLLRSSVKKTISTGKRNLELRHKLADGTVREVEVLSGAIKIDGKTLLHSIVFDVSEKKLAENEAAISRQMLEDYKYALDQSANIIITDKKGIILDVNENTCRLSGYSRKELIGSHTRVNKSGYHPVAFYKELWSTIQSGNVWHGEIKNMAKDGNYYWVDTTIVPFMGSSGKPDRYLAIRFDITAEKQARENLVLKEQRFRSVIQEGSDYIAIVDFQGVYKYVSPSYEHLLGRKTREIIGTNGVSYIHPDDAESFKKEFDKLKEQKHVTAENYRFLNKKLGWRWYKTTATNLSDDPAVGGIVLNSSDITEQVVFNFIDGLERDALKKFASNESLGGIMEDILRKIQGFFDGMRCAVFVRKADTLELLTAPGASIGFLDIAGKLIIDEKGGPSEMAAATGEKQVINDVWGDEKWKSHRSLAKKEKIRTSWAYPVKKKQSKDVTAVVMAYFGKPNHKGEYEQRAIERVVNLLRIFLESIEKDEQISTITRRYEFANMASRDAIYEWDIINDMHYWDDRYTELFGHEIKSNDFNLDDFTKLIHPDEVEKMNDRFEAALQNPSENYWNAGFRFLKSDGTYANVEEKAYILRDEKGNAVKMIGALTDVTEKKAAEIRNELINEIGNKFTESDSLETVFRQILGLILDYDGFRVGEIWLKSTDSKQLMLAASQSVEGFGSFYDHTQNLDIFLPGSGLPGSVWKSGKTIVWDNIHQRKDFIRNIAAKKTGLNTAYGLPLTHNDEVVAVLVLLSDTENKKHRPLDVFDDAFCGFMGSEIHRKQLELELNKIFEVAPDIICIAGFDGYFHKINPAASKLLGYSMDELLGKPITDFVHPDDRGTTSFEMDAIREHRANHTFENRYLTKDGKVVWISWTSKPAYEEKIVYALGRDVTKKKELESLINEVSDMARVGAWELTVTENGGFNTYWSPMVKDIIETEPDYDPNYSDDIELYEPESKERVSAAIADAVKNGIPFDLELKMVTHKGNGRWVRCMGRPEFIEGRCTRIYGSIQDIHATKVAQEELGIKSVHIQAISKLNAALLNYRDWYNALNENLSVIGDAVNADRVYYFENRFDPETGEGHTTQKLEWCREGVSVQLENPEMEEIPFKEVPELVDLLIENKPSSRILSDVEEGTFTRHVLEDQNIKAFLAIPIMIRGVFHGFVGFDNCRVERYWNDGEVEMLQTIASNLATAIERDSTDKKLQELLDDRNAILESISDAFYAVDENWEFTYFNREAERLLGVMAGEALGKSIWEVFAPARETELFEHYQSVMKDQKTVAFEYFYPPLNTWFDVSAYPSANGISVFFRDITEKKEALEKLRVSNERFERVSEATQDAIWDFQVSEENLYWGKGHFILFGYHSDSFPNTLKAWEGCIHPDDRERVISSMSEVLYNPEKKLWQCEYRYKKADGTYAYTFDRGSVIRDDNGKPLRMIGAMQDITQRKEYEESLNKLNRELSATVRELALSNSDLEQFAFVASHDLQEPLRMITSFLAQIERKYNHILDERGKQYIHFATDGAKRMRQIILDLLQFSRVGRLDVEKTTVNMQEVFDDVLMVNRKHIQDNGAVITHSKLPVIHASKTMMNHTLHNIINNAIKYHKEGTKPEIRLESSETDTHWAFSIKDNGIGIDPQYRDKIFNIFQRLHGKHEFSGTGVGLAICKKAVEFHHGQIWVESEPGKGSTFHFTISKPK